MSNESDAVWTAKEGETKHFMGVTIKVLEGDTKLSLRPRQVKRMRPKPPKNLTE